MRKLFVPLLCAVACGTPSGAPDAATRDSGFTPSDAGRLTLRTPVLSSLQPASASSGAAAFTLQLGGDFDPDALVLWDSQPLATRVVSGTQLQADVPAELVVFAAEHAVRVVLTGAGGAASAARPFTVVDGPAIPAIDMLVPARVTAGNAAFDVTVKGWNFTSASVAKWQGAARATTVVSSVELKLTVLASDVAAAGMADVTVSTPGASATSAVAPFTIDVRVALVTTIERVSLARDGGESSGAVRGAVLSADGRYVAFSSTGSDLVALDTNGREDVFVRDTCRGAGGCTPMTVRASLGEDGGQADGDSRYVSINATGRYVTFISEGTNLVGGDMNGVQDVFVRDTCLGAASCTPTTVRASVAHDGSDAVSDSEFPVISGSGRYVVFLSNAANLVVGGTTTRDVYRRDTCFGAVGCTPSTVRISEALDGTPANGGAATAGINADGRYVVFASFATNLDAGVATGRPHAYLRDTCAGAVGCTPALTPVDVGMDGGEANDRILDHALAVSATGRYVAFISSSSNLTPQPVGSNYQLFMSDLCTGASGCTPSTQLVSVALSGTAGGDSFCEVVTMTPDGRYVAFNSRSTDLVAGDTNNRADLFARDLCTGATSCTPRTTRVSVAADGGEAEAAAGNELPPGLTSDGKVASWSSGAANLVDDDTNGSSDAFVAGTGQ